MHTPGLDTHADKKKWLTPAAYLSWPAWERLGRIASNGLVFALAAVYLFPLAFMVVTSFKHDRQFSSVGAPPWPALPETVIYEDRECFIYNVPTDEGVRRLALVKPGRELSLFLDPDRPELGLLEWEGKWRILERSFVFSPTLEIFKTVWRSLRFPSLVRNTLMLVGITELAAMAASILVAYGFARYRFPGDKFLFILLIATIMIPEKVTMIPTYYIYHKLGWVGSFMPLVVPHLFGNAIFIFLLRQNFKSIPREIEEAAMLDGAGPLRMLRSIVLPQTYPAVLTVALLHFFYIWNETRMASLYLGTNPSLFPVAIGVQNGQALFPPPNFLQASALMVMIVPVIVLFISQRIFMQRMLVTGQER